MSHDNHTTPDIMNFTIGVLLSIFGQLYSHLPSIYDVERTVILSILGGTCTVLASNFWRTITKPKKAKVKR